MPARKPITLGTRFTRLVVIGPVIPRKKGGKAKGVWFRCLCRCDCGKEVVKEERALRFGTAQSCGCLGLEMLAQYRLKHGGSKTSAYQVWMSMNERCNNPNSDNYPNYGGRGIKICERWKSFSNFYADMGERPEGMSIDRINNNGDYSPENCRWATNAEQARNKRTNISLSVCGFEGCLEDIAKHFGLVRNTLDGRLKRGWPLERAVTAKPHEFYHLKSKHNAATKPC